jgi:glycosyltransferase involved in cell wall biosynthesis
MQPRGYKALNKFPNLKIIFTVTNDLTYDQRMFRICSSLAKHGYDIELVGRKLPNSKPLSSRLYKQKRLTCFFNKGKLFYAEYNIRLFFYLLFHRADAICSIDLDTILPGYYISRMKGIKFIYDAHEYFTQVPEVLQRKRVQAFWEGVEKKIIPGLKNAYTVNSSLANLFLEKYKTPFEVIYNAPEYSEQNFENNFSQRILLYQGALNASRGLEQLINAMQHIDAMLWIIGEGDLSAPLRQQVNRLGLNDKVIFKGMVPPDELPAFTRQATIGINVSENAGLSYYYSLNNKCFDYMHGALPAITNNFPEYQTINELYEISVLSDCEEDLLINDVNKLLNDLILYEKLKQNCLLAAQFFCWQNEEVKLLDFYANLR